MKKIIISNHNFNIFGKIHCLDRKRLDFPRNRDIWYIFAVEIFVRSNQYETYKRNGCHSSMAKFHSFTASHLLRWSGKKGSASSFCFDASMPSTHASQRKHARPRLLKNLKKYLCGSLRAKRGEQTAACFVCACVWWGSSSSLLWLFRSWYHNTRTSISVRFPWIPFKAVSGQRTFLGVSSLPRSTFRDSTAAAPFSSLVLTRTGLSYTRYSAICGLARFPASDQECSLPGVPPLLTP